MNSSPAVNTVISKYNEKLLSLNVNDKDSLELEIGIRFSADSAQPLAMKYIYSKTLDKLKSISSSIEIIQNLDIFYSDNVRKTMIFSEGVNQKKDVIIKKQSLAKPFVISRDIKNIKDIKLKLSYEEKLTENDIKGNVEFMKFKLRLRFILSKDKNYMAELDLVKVVKQESDLKNIKNAIFKKYNIDSITNALEFSLFDECRLEYEFINNKELSIEKVFEPINEIAVFNNSGVEVGNYQKYIFSLARQIISNNKNYLETFRFKSGLKKLLNNVIEMDSNLYYKQIQPKITSDEGFYITDKIDGKRSILMIKYMKSDLSNCNVVILNNNLTLLKEIKLHKNKANNVLDYITLDCELLEENNKKELFVFDVITFNSSKYTSKPFNERLAVMKEAVDRTIEILNLSNINVNIRTKEFVLLTSKWKEELTNFYQKASNQKYEIDGIIFTPNDKSDYSKMVGYKWKPAEHSTIDFYMKKVPDEILNTSPELFKREKKNTKNKDDDCIYYILFSGISRKDLESFNIKTMTHYDTIVGKLKDGGLMPIQFETSDKPYNYIFRQCKENSIDLNNKIGEFGWDGKQWVLKRIRTDRDVELARGEYYGNYYKVAENIWYSINNPLTFDDLLKENNGMYFMADNVDVYKEQRNFNSYVKTVAIQSIIEQVKLEGNSSPLLIDLAAGKGQDLARIANLGVKDSIFVDNDKSAIQELIRRKHSIRNFNMKVSTVHSDLNSDYKEVINNIESSYGKKLNNSVDIIICNFAIHYIANNVDKLKNVIQLISYLLKTNGIFMFTCFDGTKVKKICNENGWDAKIEDSEVLKYSIRKLNNSRISLILPFSNGKYYEEDLLDIQLLQQIFNDNGFSTESLGSFSNMIYSYKNKENLSNDDKIFSGLYSYNVYRKNTESGSSIIVKKNPYSIISKNLTSDIKEGGFDVEEEINNLSSLDNVPLNNIIVFINTMIGSSENINSVAIKDIKSKLESYGYRDLQTNSKLRKKIYMIHEDNDKLYKFLEQKTKKNIVSVIILERDFLNIYEEYFKYLIKLPVNNINIMNKCLILNSIDFIKYKKEFGNITINIFKQFNNDNSICYNI